MKLQNFLGSNTKYGTEGIASDKDLALQIQSCLIALKLLDPPADGKFGPISTDAFERFQELSQCNEPGYLGAETAKKLIETKLQDLQLPSLNLGNDLASRIIKYMQKKRYHFATGSKEYNIIYIEGMNSNGSLNDDTPNEFNDLRMVIEFVNGIPKIAGSWEATTEPGSKYTHNPDNPGGAARIKFGQYRAWRVGLHGTSNPHRALIQVSPVSVHRDFDQNFIRTGDFVDTGTFGINQHWGYDHPKNDVYNASAGCLVGRSTQGHKEFMALIEQDRRYLATPKGAPTFHGDPPERTYVFRTTIIPGDELLQMVPG